mgnify:CR=1 FL=1
MKSKAIINNHVKGDMETQYKFTFGDEAYAGGHQSADIDYKITLGDIGISNLLGSDPAYKFNEGALISEFKKYVDSTYDSHYSKQKFQATEFIIDGGHGTGFCIGNVLKYAQRYGKKGAPKDARKDLMKVLHYALIQLSIHDEENKII